MYQEDNRLDRSFYLKDTLQIAKDLLGKYLVHESSEGRTVGRIVETEGYLGVEDPASHAYEGKRTERTEDQYRSGGHAYVYLIYGMYHCFNVVTRGEDEPESVFVRALEPIEGKELMKERRGLKEASGKKILELTDGPGKLCMAMGIDEEDSGKDLCGDELYIVWPSREEDLDIQTGKRINIDYSREAKKWPWRYYIEDNEYVSRKDR